MLGRCTKLIESCTGSQRLLQKPHCGQYLVHLLFIFFKKNGYLNQLNNSSKHKLWRILSNIQFWSCQLLSTGRLEFDLNVGRRYVRYIVRRQNGWDAKSSRCWADLSFRRALASPQATKFNLRRTPFFNGCCDGRLGPHLQWTIERRVKCFKMGQPAARYRKA